MQSHRAVLMAAGLAVVVVVFSAGCSAALRHEHQENIYRFNQDVTQWNSDFSQMQLQAKTLTFHPGRGIDTRLSEALARAAARGATTIRAMVAGATEELEPQRQSMSPVELEYAWAARGIALRIADLAERREDLERRRQELTHEATRVADAEQRRAFWMALLLTAAANPPSSPPSPSTTSFPTSYQPPLPIQCFPTNTVGAYSIICR